MNNYKENLKQMEENEINVISNMEEEKVKEILNNFILNLEEKITNLEIRLIVLKQVFHIQNGLKNFSEETQNILQNKLKEYNELFKDRVGVSPVIRFDHYRDFLILK